VADRIMVRVAADENLHMMFYRDIVAAALQADPSAAVQAITGEVIGFAMPGVGIQGFTGKALQMARAGIYDLRIHHDEILWPLLRYWNLFQLQDLQPQAEQARDRLAAHPAKTTDWPADSRPNAPQPPPPTKIARPAEQAQRAAACPGPGSGPAPPRQRPRRRPFLGRHAG
jgi:hypothetical protein